MKVKDSPLYKTLCEAVRKEDHAELLRMLEMVPALKGHPARLLRRSLRSAFLWFTTPQGFDYWGELSKRLERAGWECW